MKITVLGCGGSFGVPQLACNCYVCQSTDAKNKRTRTSILIESHNTTILVDISPDFRQQALKHNIKKIDAVIVTHPHADHFTGIDDLRPYCQQKNSLMPIYMASATWDLIGRNYAYLFQEHDSKSIYRHIMEARIVKNYDKIIIQDLQIQLFNQHHGAIDSLGLRIGDFAYSTDFNIMPAESELYLYNLKYWIVDCLKYSWAPSHSCYEQSIALIEKFNPETAILTHLAHEVDYNACKRILPANIQPAFDGMILEL